MQISHGVSAVFDDPNLVSAGGLAPVLGLAERAGLHRLVAEHLTVPGSAGANKVVKIPSLVAGMVAPGTTFRRPGAPWPDSSSKTSQAPRSAAVLLIAGRPPRARR